MMQTVYVVLCNVDYEESAIEYIFANEADAKAKALFLQEQEYTEHVHYDVEAWGVIP